MKTFSKNMILAFLTITLGCSKDDNEAPEVPMEPEDPVVQNMAPLDFELIAVTDNAVAVDVLPSFSWNASTDPDGDTVTYDLYLNSGEAATELFAGNISGTTFQVTERLGLLESYAWRVVAKDPEGANSSSDTRNFSTRAVRFSDTPTTSNAGFSARSGHTSVVFDNKLWVIGGSSSSIGLRNDVWYSEDGESWIEATGDAQFSPRSDHTTAIFDNKIWVIGGFVNNSNSRNNEVWYSEDGINWIDATSGVPFTGRVGHASLVFDNKLWVIGGRDETGDFKNDVWFTADGLTWSEATSAAPFSGRRNHTAVAFDNKIWVIGESASNLNRTQIWSSSDGINWEEPTTASPFIKRFSHTSVVFDNKLWVIGGTNENFDLKNDLWVTEDGTTWSEVTDNAPFTARSNHTSLVFDNRVWVIGGFQVGSSLNDVWTFE